MIRTSAQIAGNKEPTIALINIVFLMLIFFMIAGTLAPPLDRSVALIRTSQLEGREPPDTLILREDGSLWMRGIELTSVAGFMERLTDEDRSAVRVVPDRNLPAKTLMKHVNEIRSEGAERVLIVSERGLQ